MKKRRNLDEGSSAGVAAPFPRAAIYARVSTADQTCENQLLELHRYATARGWTVVDYVDQGVSGAKDRRPTEWVLGVSRIVERGALARDVEEER